MKLKELIDTLLSDCNIAIRDENNENICTTRSNSKGVIPYLNKEVIKWFPSGTLLNPADFTVTLKEV